MLRVMKQKAQHDASRVDAFKAQTGSPESTPPVQGSIVSHVPVSIGSRTTSPMSANSSISSEDADSNDCISSRAPINELPAAPFISQQDRIQDSPNESSDSTPKVLDYVKDETSSSLKSSLAVKVPRCLEACESSQVCTTSSEPPFKKQRLDLCYPVTQSTSLKSRPIAPAPSTVVLLARPEDSAMLNPLHAFVRSQIEVFCATPSELAQPAPGRKHPIRLHQVGLRCIHCRDIPSRRRVKRAICYPTSVDRVYHSVSDMKFDHFTNCRQLPLDLRAKFEELKAANKRSTKDNKKSAKSSGYASSTAQYYHDSSIQMGMVDGPGGIFMASKQQGAWGFLTAQGLTSSKQQIPATPSNLFSPTHTSPSRCFQELEKPRKATTIVDRPRTGADHVSVTVPPSRIGLPRTSGSKQIRISLASPADKDHLNPLHCFVRRNVEIFTADRDDIAAPAPGRKARVKLGQVGIRCIHCAHLPLKDRVKRAVCYPPSVGGIYHSVSNMKFDHFGICRGLPANVREEFAALKTSSSRRGGSAPSSNSSSGSRGSSISTAQYYIDSAANLGLLDTDTGIRFCPSVTFSNKDVVKDTNPPCGAIPIGMSVLMIAAATHSI